MGSAVIAHVGSEGVAAVECSPAHIAAACSTNQKPIGEKIRRIGSGPAPRRLHG